MKARRLSWTKPSPSVDVSSHGESCRGRRAQPVGRSLDAPSSSQAAGGLAEKGGSRTLRGPDGPQTGFEDQRRHRAPSFSTATLNRCLTTENGHGAVGLVVNRLSICQPRRYERGESSIARATLSRPPALAGHRPPRGSSAWGVSMSRVTVGRSSSSSAFRSPGALIIAACAGRRRLDSDRSRQAHPNGS